MLVGFISNIHEDIVCLKLALQILTDSKCSAVVCLGDLVGYSVPHFRFLASRDSHAVIELVSATCATVVAGNHDLYAIRKTPQLQRIFDYPPNWYALDYHVRKARSKGDIWLYEENELSALLTASDKAYLASLPEYAVCTFDGVRVFVSHYAYPDLTGDSRKGRPFASSAISEHFSLMIEHDCRLAVSGHALAEGVQIFTESMANQYPFGVYKLPDERVWISGPAVANGTSRNGVVIFNTATMEISAIPIGAPTHTIPEWSNR
ncbi:MAG: metallophosphoesterase family protein [Anaerolineae bacterium]